MNQSPASPIQTQFYMADQLYSGTGLNTLWRAIRIEGPLDEGHLAGALAALKSAHPALRTRFRTGKEGIVIASTDQETASTVLEIQDSDGSEETVTRFSLQVRKSLSPGTKPWAALLLRHSPETRTLLFCAHHSVFDEDSFSVAAEDITRAYGGAALSETPQDGRTDLGPQARNEALAFFKESLKDLPGALGFPGVTQRPKVLGVAADSVEGTWVAGTSVRLKEAAARWNQSESVVVTAAAAYLLSRYTNQPRMTFGMAFSLGGKDGRRRTIGSLTSHLPLTLDPGTASSFSTLVQTLGDRHRSTEVHAALPFSEIFRNQGSPWDPSSNPLFQVSFEAEQVFLPQFPGCRCTPLSGPPSAQQLDLFFQFRPEGFRISYGTGAAPREGVRSLARSLETFLEAALDAPEVPLDRLPVTGTEDRERLVAGVNKTEVPEYLTQDLYSLVSRHFAGPENGKPALVSRGQTLSYAGLAGRVGAISQLLADPEAPAGGLVGICLPRSFDMVASMAAVLRAGKAYVPLDPGFPEDRLRYMAEHSGLTHIITTPELARKFAGLEVRFLHLEPLAQGPGIPRVEVPGSAPAYVIYTSGSTGKPKGVAVPRAALANFLSSMAVTPGIGPADVLCAVTTLSFDIAELELLGPLCAGGTTVIATEDEAKDPKQLAGLLKSSRATILQATPVTWQFLGATGWAGDPHLKALCGGEALTPALAHALVPKVGELWNMYGPTETTVWSTCRRVTDPVAPVTVGQPIANTTVHVLDDHLRPVPPGVEGQLFIGGAGVALGYLHDQELTDKKFLTVPALGAGRIYDTGDRARFDHGGDLSIVGRSDFQVKIRGYRIELGEIETRVAAHPAAAQVVVGVNRDDPGNPELIAFYTLVPGAVEPGTADWRKHCSETLPAYMVPAQFRSVAAFPLTPNAKVDRNALLRDYQKTKPAQVADQAPVRPRNDVERDLADLWKKALGTETPGTGENFFELGGTSVTALTLALEIGKKFNLDFSVLKIFEFPTVASLAGFLNGVKEESRFIREAKDRAALRRKQAPSATAFDVAVIGAAGRFPGASNLDQLWEVLSHGRDTVTVFDRKDLDPIVPDRDRNDPAYIPARGILEGIDLFDGNFFGIPPNEAELMDPQQRVFLEVCWEAFEHAGYVGETIDGSVGVWAAKGNDFYYVYNVLTRPDKLAIMGDIAAEIANEKDHVAPRISHKLNLTGPSLSVHTACSSTLVVVENAYQALVTYQVDVALAGGVDIRTPQKSGQRYEDGGIFSDDGHCRPFDAQATGTMFGEGAGALVLKRLDDAVRDNDNIMAVIKGAAVNHDGGRKVSYLAPSVEGQARVIASALALGDVDPGTVSFIEAHGTATPMGDPIEVEALNRVFRAYTDRKGFCALGSIKGNFGHATTAAGIAGLLKIILSMKHRQIPATLNYSSPNPRIDFENSPFFVNNKLIDWKPDGVPLRAGVSSFGFCGTNAHIVLEEAPAKPAPVPAARPWQVFLLSAKNPNALSDLAQRYAGALGNLTDPGFADAAYTTQVGRKRFEHRRAVVARSAEEAETTFLQASGGQNFSVKSASEDPPVAFMFPGQGSQYINMGSRFYQGEPLFRQTVDHCCEVLRPHLGCDLRDFLFPAAADSSRATESLNNTFYTQPAIFTISYSLAVLMKSWGIEPTAFVGHSIGEFVAATLSGVMVLNDALKLVAARGRLMQSLPGGSMLSVRLPEETLRTKLPAGIDMAAVNSPKLCVVAGPTEQIDRFAAALEADGVACRKLHTSHAFHSSMMDPVVEEFRRIVESVPLSPPQVPFVSTVLGDWITPEAATDPGYWARHLRSPVQFSQAVKILLEDPRRVLVECGPRRTSVTLALQQQPENPGRVVATMPDSSEPADEYPSLLLAMGTLWAQGSNVDWNAFHTGETRRRTALPTYPFQRRRYWIEPGDTTSFGFDTSGAPVPPADRAGELQEIPAEVPAGPGTSDPLMAGLVTILEDTLGEQIGSFNEDAKFIELGLDSLLLTQLARIVRQKMGFEVTFRQLFSTLSTPRLLVDAVRAGSPGSVQTPRPSVPAAPVTGQTPPAATQEAVPVPRTGARLGKDEQGRPAWYVPDPARPGKFLKAADHV